jgi:hypothetical protein
MTDAVKIALIGALGTAASGELSVLIIVLLRRLEVKVDGRLTELLKANKRADTAQGRQDERYSQGQG